MEAALSAGACSEAMRQSSLRASHGYGALLIELGASNREISRMSRGGACSDLVIPDVPLERLDIPGIGNGHKALVRLTM